jgi:hypothetical protein
MLRAKKKRTWRTKRWHLFGAKRVNRTALEIFFPKTSSRYICGFHLASLLVDPDRDTDPDPCESLSTSLRIRRMNSVTCIRSGGSCRIRRVVKPFGNWIWNLYSFPESELKLEPLPSLTLQYESLLFKGLSLDIALANPDKRKYKLTIYQEVCRSSKI